MCDQIFSLESAIATRRFHIFPGKCLFLITLPVKLGVHFCVIEYETTCPIHFE
jgi:hypothetical protein